MMKTSFFTFLLITCIICVTISISDYVHQPRNTAYIVQVNKSTSSAFETLQRIYKVWKIAKDAHELSLAYHRHLIIYQIGGNVSDEYDKVCSIFQFPASVSCKLLTDEKAQLYRMRCDQSNRRTTQEISELLHGSTSLVLICDWWGLSQQKLLSLNRKTLRNTNMFLSSKQFDDETHAAFLPLSLAYALELNYFFVEYLQNRWYSVRAGRESAEIVIGISKNYHEDEYKLHSLVEWIGQDNNNMVYKKNIHFIVEENDWREKFPECIRNVSFLSNSLKDPWIHFYELHLLLTVPVVIMIGSHPLFDVVKEQRKNANRVTDYFEYIPLRTSHSGSRYGHRFSHNPTYSLGLNEATSLLIPSLDAIEENMIRDTRNNLLAAMVESFVIAWIHVIESATLRRRLIFAGIVTLSVILYFQRRKNALKYL